MSILQFALDFAALQNDAGFPIRPDEHPECKLQTLQHRALSSRGGETSMVGDPGVLDVIKQDCFEDNCMPLSRKKRKS